MPRKQKGGKKQKPKPKPKQKPAKKANNTDSKTNDVAPSQASAQTQQSQQPQQQQAAASNGANVNGSQTQSNSETNNANGNANAERSETEEKKTSNNGNDDITQLLMRRNPRRWQVPKDKSHAFWDGQPVPTMKEKIKDAINEPIEVKQLSDVRKEPYLLPANFEWCNLDLKNDTELTELYNLLYNHYVEDDDNMFRFNYSKQFLQWALLVPDYIQEWHLGVRVKPKQAPQSTQGTQGTQGTQLSNKKRGKLCACITAIPALVNINDKRVKMVEINFLCVYKTLRSKRLAPVLIKEITRRVNCRNIWQAVYTAGVVIPKPVASNRYWHRSLNPKKLIDIGFSCMRQRMTMPRLLRLYRVDNDTKTVGLRKMHEKDSKQCWKLLNDYLSKFKLKIEFSFEEFKHLLLPRDDVVYSYVVATKKPTKDDSKNDNTSSSASSASAATEEEESEEIVTDFFSFYNLSSTVINNPKYTNMKAGYSYYNVSTKTPLKDLISDALVIAKKEGFDVFNALDVMENSQFLKDLKFGIGDGRLQYYMYNWRCAELQPGDVGIVLL